MKARALVAWNVRRIRVDRGISQEQLARDTGIGRSYVGGLERQSKNATIELLERIAESLRVDILELFVEPPKGATTPWTLPKARKPARPRRKTK
ncbi:helix-turn-helix transcriptional regulator [Bradyrhizobium sp. UFLA01-814]|uniref:helix-turn-helix domain-containing protein n=1 Tax=Bradyrhizobium sp. UFLA01-814 TaxID=3023480 RepID=UPI00398B647A